MGIGDWGLGIGPNPQSPFIQTLSNYLIKTLIFLNIYNNKKENIPKQNNQISRIKEYIYK